MSKFDEKLAKYEEALKGVSKDAVDGEFLRKVAKGLGPSIYLRDASLVSCSDQKELDRVKANFAVKKLGVKDDAKLDAAIKEVCEEYKSRSRHRAVFYYMLAKKLGKSL